MVKCNEHIHAFKHSTLVSISSLSYYSRTTALLISLPAHLLQRITIQFHTQKLPHEASRPFISLKRDRQVNVHSSPAISAPA